MDDIRDQPPEALELHLNKRVRLRQFTAGDIPSRYELVRRNQAYLQPWVAWAGKNFSQGTITNMTAADIAAYRAGTAYSMGIYTDDMLVGTVDIRDIGSTWGPEIGYLMDESYTGRGIATLAAESLLVYARQQHPDIRRVRLTTYTDNPASQHVAEKLGFVFDHTEPDATGRLESYYIKNYE